MRILLIGGTRFIGPHVIRNLSERGHELFVFHRGQTHADLPAGVQHIFGDHQNLARSLKAFEHVVPQAVIHMVAFTERDASEFVKAFAGIAQRLIVLSSMDVYRAFDGLRRVYCGTPDAVPLSEDAPLREQLFPYRPAAKDANDLAYHYEKILVERVVMSAGRPATVLRLPMVYGPLDYQHRLYPYLKRMDDGRTAILLGAGQMNWRWTRGYVEDVAEAIALAVTDSRSMGRIYNVGEERARSEGDWVRNIGRLAGWRGSVAAIPDEQLPAHLRPDLNWDHHCECDTSRLRRELGYREKLSLDEGLSRTIAWERQNPPSLDPKNFDYNAEDEALAKHGAGA